MRIVYIFHHITIDFWYAWAHSIDVWVYGTIYISIITCNMQHHQHQSHPHPTISHKHNYNNITGRFVSFRGHHVECCPCPCPCLRLCYANGTWWWWWCMLISCFFCAYTYIMYRCVSNLWMIHIVPLSVTWKDLSEKVTTRDTFIHVLHHAMLWSCLVVSYQLCCMLLRRIIPCVHHVASFSTYHVISYHASCHVSVMSCAYADVALLLSCVMRCSGDILVLLETEREARRLK